MSLAETISIPALVTNCHSAGVVMPRLILLSVVLIGLMWHAGYVTPDMGVMLSCCQHHKYLCVAT